MAEGRNLWAKEELILALNLYLKLPFSKINKTNSEVIKLAHLMGRTPNSVAIRLANFAHVDPYHQQRGVKGMSGGKKQVEPIWDEFINNKENLIFESERILAEKEHQTIEDKYSEILSDIIDLKGETKVREVKTRVNQSVFRTIVLANYNNKCAVTGIANSELLIASHILSWADNEKERLNPKNGICLNSLHDKAFDCGLITITPDYKIKISSVLKKQNKVQVIEEYFLRYDNEQMTLPTKFLPDNEFLKYHNRVRFQP